MNSFMAAVTGAGCQFCGEVGDRRRCPTCDASACSPCLSEGPCPDCRARARADHNRTRAAALNPYGVWTPRR